MLLSLKRLMFCGCLFAHVWPTRRTSRAAVGGRRERFIELDKAVFDGLGREGLCKALYKGEDTPLIEHIGQTRLPVAIGADGTLRPIPKMWSDAMKNLKLLAIGKEGTVVSIGAKGTGGADEAEATDKDTGADAFTFAQEGDGYYLAGFGESGHVRKLKGFDIISRLIRTPSIHVAMVELVGAGDDERLSRDGRSRQETLDLQALGETRDKLAELREDYASARAKTTLLKWTLPKSRLPNWNLGCEPTPG